MASTYWLFEGNVVAVSEPIHLDFFPDMRFARCYSFYDPRNGQVWFQRITEDSEREQNWNYVPCKHPDARRKSEFDDLIIGAGSHTEQAPITGWECMNDYAGVPGAVLALVFVWQWPKETRYANLPHPCA